MRILLKIDVKPYISVSLLLLSVPILAQQKPNPALVRNYGKLPLSFEKNIGQTDKRVKFFSRGSGYSLFLTPKEAIFSLKKSSPKPKTKQPTHAKPEKTEGAVLRMQLVGANAQAKETTQAKLSGTTNYFRGNDKSQWRTGVENYGRVGFSGVYKGVDVVYYGNQRQLEYDFIVKPKAQPSEIRLKFAGAKRVKALPSGELLLETGNGSLKWHAPLAYQEADGKRKPVPAKYQISQGREVCFAVGDYDKSRPLVIDPVLAYSTYLGGNPEDYAYAIAVDSAGNAYVAGHTYDTDFPTTTGAFQPKYNDSGDGFVTKLSADGKSLLYSTYLGGSDSDYASAIAVDSKGNAYVAGSTQSTDFPTTTGAFQTQNKGRGAFVTKLSANGKSLLYSTYLGGTKDDYAHTLALDSAGNAYVAGSTKSSDFPTTTGAFQTQNKGYDDAFVTKLSADGKSLIYSTYLGGSGYWDYANALTVDSAGNAYVAGFTKSSDFPTTTGAFQTQNKANYGTAFVTKLSADGKSLVYSTFLGGGDFDTASAIAVDSAGNAYLAGSTYSTDFPTTTGAFQTQYNGAGYYDGDGFVTKLSADGKSLLYSTFLGGYYDGDSAHAIALDSAGNAYVVGVTYSDDFPTTEGAFQTQYKGGGYYQNDFFVPYSDVFVTKLSADGKSLLYSTYLGGSGDDGASAIAVDSKGNAYVAGDTSSTDFPTTTGAFQTQNKGGGDAFVTKWNLPHSFLILPVQTILGGEATTATVLLDKVATADTTVSLASDNSLVTIPSSVVVKKGTNSATINVTTSAPTKDTEVHLTTTPTSKLAYSVLWVYPPRTLTKFTVDSVMVFGTQGKGVVTLDGITADAGAVINITSSNTLLTVPSSVTIPAQKNTASFVFTAGSPTKDTTVKVTAEYKGVKITKSVKILSSKLDTFTLSVSSVTGGSSLTGTVTAKGTVPAGGLVVTLKSNNAAAVVPATVTILAGKTSADFTITTTKVTKKATPRIYATTGNVQLSQVLTVNP